MGYRHNLSSPRPTDVSGIWQPQVLYARGPAGILWVRLGVGAERIKQRACSWRGRSSAAGTAGPLRPAAPAGPNQSQHERWRVLHSMRSVLNPTGRLTFCTAASHSGAPSQAVTLEAAFIPAGS